MMNLYNSKSNDYFSGARREIIDFVPLWSERVLEIGCGSGQTLELLKQLKLCEVTVGIDFFKSAVEDARTRVDLVYHLDIERQELPLELGKFDLILILDVLEHLVDPWGTLEYIQRTHLKSTGKMIISLPNARHFSCILPLLFKGEFAYQERGILDKTHLRFFTRKSGMRLLQEAGLSVENIKSTSLDWSLNSGKLNAVTFGIFSDFLTSQFIYLTCLNRNKSNFR